MLNKYGGHATAATEPTCECYLFSAGVPVRTPTLVEQSTAVRETIILSVLTSQTSPPRH